MMSLGVKLILIKHVLKAIPLYLMSLIQPPKIIIKAIQSISSNFFGHDQHGTHKAHWVKWSSMCYLEEEGGIGIRY